MTGLLYRGSQNAMNLQHARNIFMERELLGSIR